ncbi:MAG: hypothetical protein OEZ06_14325 [Myxococcales bacterium]|nr:hypothetical protein [Myxococcales bacterium]
MRQAPETQEMLFYFERAGPDAPWYMNFETSLRAAEKRGGEEKSAHSKIGQASQK